MIYKTGVDTLREVVIFENPKYAFVFEKGSKNYYIEELWGVGKATESDISPEERRACAYFNEEETVSDYFRFLYLQHGVLWPFNRDDFILLNQLPSK